MMQMTTNENAACLTPRICKRFHEPKIERIANNDAELILHRKLKGQWHNRVKLKAIATINSCFDVVGSRQHYVASCEVISWSTHIHKPSKSRWWWPQMKLRSKSLPTGQCDVQNTWQKAIGKNPEYHVAAVIRKLRTDTNCPAGKSWPNHVKNEQHIGPEKTYGPNKILQKHNDAKDRKRKCCLLSRLWRLSPTLLFLPLKVRFLNQMITIRLTDTTKYRQLYKVLKHEGTEF